MSMVLCNIFHNLATDSGDLISMLLTFWFEPEVWSDFSEDTLDWVDRQALEVPPALPVPHFPEQTAFLFFAASILYMHHALGKKYYKSFLAKQDESFHSRKQQRRRQRPCVLPDPSILHKIFKKLAWMSYINWHYYSKVKLLSIYVDDVT